ncbi:hypothetical protein BH09CHL1_BH09CHL1_31070 [soil metagenome]
METGLHGAKYENAELIKNTIVPFERLDTKVCILVKYF